MLSNLSSALNEAQVQELLPFTAREDIVKRNILNMILLIFNPLQDTCDESMLLLVL